MAVLKGDISRERMRSGDSAYPPPHSEKVKGRKTWPLTSQWKLTQFGVNRVDSTSSELVQSSVLKSIWHSAR